MSLKIIRKYCLDCSGSSNEVELCNVEACTFYSWRFNKTPKEPTSKAKTSLKAIREYCVECSQGNKAEVRKCHIEDCPLYNHRMGKNPLKAGFGNPNPTFGAIYQKQPGQAKMSNVSGKSDQIEQIKTTSERN